MASTRSGARGDGRTAEFESISGEGNDPSRIIALSDGVFGFAMTLLVVNLLLPTTSLATQGTDLLTYLTLEWPTLVDYALAFYVVAAWWSAHHRLFSAIRRYDTALLRLNNTFLLLISVTPFILALVFVYGPRGFLDAGLSAKLAVAIFSGVQLAIGAIAFAMWRHATHGHRLVDADLPDDWIGYFESLSVLRMGVMGAALAVAFVLPVIGEIAWFGLLLHRHVVRSPSKLRSGGPAT